jgi:hypothetical protein
LAHLKVFLKMTRTRALLLVLLSSALAAPLWAQGNYTAASCNYSDVNAVINGPAHVAVDGDTINVPSGNCTWTSSLSVSKGISIIGAGSGSTVILDDINHNQVIKISLLSASETFRLSSMTIQPSPSLNSSMIAQPGIANIGGTCNSTTCSHIRLDNLTMPGWLSGTNFQGFLMYIDDFFGVMDHLNVNQNGEFVAIGQSTYGGVGNSGDNSWAQSDSYGTDNELYIESSTFATSDGRQHAVTDTDFGGGARFVFRFNNLTNSTVQTHGTESTGRTRGSRHVEVYNNTLLCTDNSSGCDFAGLRSGTALTFDNTLQVSGGGWINHEMSLGNLRVVYPFPPWSMCDGQGSYDKNDGTVYASGTVSGVTVSGQNVTITDTSKNWTAGQWVNNSGDRYSWVDTTLGQGWQVTANTSNTLTAQGCGGFNGICPTINQGDSYQILRSSICIDQTGHGQGSLLSGSPPTPTGWVNEALDPVYEWGTTFGGNTPVWGWVGTSTPANVIENRDYYQEVAQIAQSSPTNPFNGTVGTGFGTFANRPTTCTPRVAYWATDQGNWNQSGGGGQGQLYVCTATNTWTQYYVPYSYPHPLTQGSGGAPPPPPTNLQAVPQ